jgi:hypothetical protein
MLQCMDSQEDQCLDLDGEYITLLWLLFGLLLFDLHTYFACIRIFLRKEQINSAFALSVTVCRSTYTTTFIIHTAQISAQTNKTKQTSHNIIPITK